MDIIFLRESFNSDIYRVSALSFHYKSDIAEWNSVVEFAENLSKNLNLPFSYWNFADKQGVMTCKDFKVTIIENYIHIQTTAIENDLKNLKEQKKKDFKP